MHPYVDKCSEAVKLPSGRWSRERQLINPGEPLGRVESLLKRTDRVLPLGRPVLSFWKRTAVQGTEVLGLD